MSLLESIIWHVLGYSAIPLIFLFGVAMFSLVFLGLVRLFGGDTK